MGELHLEIIVDRLLREFRVEANVGKPQVAFRETIRRKGEAQGKYVRQTGGRGQYGDVYIEVEPNEAGGGFVFENKIVGGSVPREYVPAVEKGIKEAMRDRRAGRLPDGGHQGLPDRRLVPRGGLQRDGLQDRRARWASRRPAARPRPSCSSR